MMMRRMKTRETVTWTNISDMPDIPYQPMHGSDGGDSGSGHDGGGGGDGGGGDHERLCHICQSQQIVNQTVKTVGSRSVRFVDFS